MKFEDARRYKLYFQNGKVKSFYKDELALLFHNWNVSYRYTALYSHKGTLELFNDVLHIIVKVKLYG